MSIRLSICSSVQCLRGEPRVTLNNSNPRIVMSLHNRRLFLPAAATSSALTGRFLRGDESTSPEWADMGDWGIEGRSFIETETNL